MLNLIQKDDLNEYTRPSQWVDYETPEIQKRPWNYPRIWMGLKW